MYNEFYDFKALPFRLNPDPEFFFGSQGHKRALSYLRYGLSQREGFIVVTGMPGTGKTTLARELLAEIGDDKIIVGELNTTHLEAEDVLRMAAASFGVAHENVPKATLLNRLENFFLSKHRAGFHCLLLIDESQNLPPSSIEELRMLSNFYQGKDALLQIFMLGQQQFRDMLQSPEMEQLRQRVVAATHLEPLDKEETRSYIIHRLKVAGWQERPVVTSRALDMVFLLTKGVPRRINTFCDRLFLYGALEELYEIDTEAVRTVGRELMLETESPDRASQIDSLQTVSSSQMEYAKSELTSAFDSSMLEGDEDQPTPPAGKGLRLVNGGASFSVPNPQSNVVVLPFDENNPDIAVVAVLQALLDGQQPALDPLPSYLTTLMELALGKQSLSVFSKGQVEDDQREALGDALRSCFKHQLLEKACDYYRRLAVVPTADAEQVKAHYRYLFRLFQVEQERDKQNWDSTFIRRINQAYATLRSEEGRSKYDNFLASVGKLATHQEEGQDSSEPEPEQVVVKPELELDRRSASPEKEDKPSPVPVVTTSQLPPAPDPELAVATKKAAADTSGGGKQKLVVGVAIALLAAVGAGGYLYDSEWADSVTQSIERETSLEVAGLVPAQPSVSEMDKPIAVAEPEEIKLPNKEQQKLVPSVAVIDEPEPVIEIETKQEIVEQKPVVEPEPPVQPKPKPKPKPVEKKVAVAKPSVVEPPKPVRPEPKPVSLQEVEQVVEEFRSTYENGDLKNFIALFTSNARTNDRHGVEQISADYKTLFESTTFRRFDLKNMRWSRGITEVNGDGRFRVSVVRSQSNTLKSYDGDIHMVMRLQDGGLKISRFDYSYK